jgi:hypothetical protein
LTTKRLRSVGFYGHAVEATPGCFDAALLHGPFLRAALKISPEDAAKVREDAAEKMSGEKD